MQPNSKEALKRFLNDAEMVKAVHSVLRTQYLKQPKERDVQFLAAAWLAKDLFEDGWKELLKFKQEAEHEARPPRQIGL